MGKFSPELRERWGLLRVALLSGDYVQGTGQLHFVEADNRHRFCCLGVACEVAIANGVDLVREELPYAGTTGDDRVARVRYNGAECYLPGPAIHWLQPCPDPMSCDCSNEVQLLLVPPFLKQPGHVRLVGGDWDGPIQMMALNDILGFSFDDIAACIDYTLFCDAYQG